MQKELDSRGIPVDGADWSDGVKAEECQTVLRRRVDRTSTAAPVAAARGAGLGSMWRSVRVDADISNAGSRGPAARVLTLTMAAAPHQQARWRGPCSVVEAAALHGDGS